MVIDLLIPSPWSVPPVMPQPRRQEGASLYWALLILVALLPLPLGGIFQWSSALMACAVGVMLAVWAARVASGRQEAGLGLRAIWPLALLFGLIAGWIGLQSLSLTPESWHHPLWASTEQALGLPIASAVSLNPADSLTGLARLGAYAGIFWLALQYGRRTARARQAMTAVVIAGAGYAALGLLLRATGGEALLPFRGGAPGEALTASFLDATAFATHAGLALVCASGLLAALLSQAWLPDAEPSARALRLLEVMAERGWPLLVAWLILAVALLVAGSRAALSSTLLALTALLLVSLIARVADGRLALFGGALSLAVLVWVVAVQSRRLGTGVAGAAPSQPQLVQQRTLEAIGDAGALGTGFGTFAEAFRFYRTPDITASFETAGNVYLENALELGLPAAAVLLTLVAGVLALCVVGVRRRQRDTVYPGIGVAATVLFASSGAFAASAHVPAITAAWALIMGAACAQCWSSRRPADPW